MGLEIVCDALKTPEKDIADLVDLQFNTFANLRQYKSRNNAQQDLQLWLDTPSMGSIIAYHNSTIAGYALYRPMNPDLKRAYSALLHSSSARFPQNVPHKFPERCTELAYVFLQRELRCGRYGHQLLSEILGEHIKKGYRAAYMFTSNTDEEHIQRLAIAAGFQTLGVVEKYYPHSDGTILKRIF